MKFNSTCLNGILGNGYESNILKNYLQGKSMTIVNLFQACCEKMESGVYPCSNSSVTTATVGCHYCVLKYFKELVYQYRRDIPSSELPVEVTRRTDCHWGNECRTQYTKIAHAQ